MPHLHTREIAHRTLYILIYTLLDRGGSACTSEGILLDRGGSACTSEGILLDGGSVCTSEGALVDRSGSVAEGALVDRSGSADVSTPKRSTCEPVSCLLDGLLAVGISYISPLTPGFETSGNSCCSICSDVLSDPSGMVGA